MSTEAIDPRYVDIDQWPTTLAVEAMLEGQMAAIAAIGSQTSRIAQAAEAAAARLGARGRLVYVGAGTSGRVELTFYGDKGVSKPIPLEYDPGSGPGFMRGATLPFRVVDYGGDVGALSKVEVRLIPELSQVGHGWMLEHISVTGEEKGKSWTFKSRKWFGESDCGGASGPLRQLLAASEEGKAQDPGSPPGQRSSGDSPASWRLRPERRPPASSSAGASRFPCPRGGEGVLARVGWGYFSYPMS